MFARILANHNLSQNIFNRGRLLSTRKPTSSLSNASRVACNGLDYSTSMSEKPTNLKESFKVVYQFSLIRAAAIVAKSKLYQTWLAGLAIPSSIALYCADLIAQETTVSIVSIGLAGTIATYSVGAICNRLVGYIYISPDNAKVKISHLDFWGRRVDSVYPTEDFVPLSELTQNTRSIYVNIKCYSSEYDSLKLSLKYGSIIDMDLFTTIFGYGVIK